MILQIILCLLCGYGFGCISTGYIVGKINHVDIREYGSGNIGTTNTLRTLGKKAGAITYIGDVLKAMVPMLLARYVIFRDLPYADLLGLYVGLGVAIGHNFPFWLHFKGGKGIAVTSGVMAAHDPLAIPLYLISFIVSVAITKYVSVGSLVIVTLFPIWIAVVDH
ncbi:MAG: glycerol-3-phosphate acyltransferase, partial [Lachnospiraceae bacterium]|nr:glycerol-3-phosphate acyltransferase [Lachnospiraceae bacterium]